MQNAEFDQTNSTQQHYQYQFFINLQQVYNKFRLKQLKMQSKQQYQVEQLKPKIEVNIRHYLPPANPITTKIIKEEPSKNHKLISTFAISNTSSCFQSKRKKKSEYVDENQEITLLNYYQNDSLVYKKLNNALCNKRVNQAYMASIFIDNFSKLPVTMNEQKNDLCEFKSDFESANLFAAYKVAERQYDLILQNDINSSGYAQWFNFRVIFKSKNKQATSVKFNIVNLVIHLLFEYKSHSLYKVGMKPLAKSSRHKKSLDSENDKDKQKGWRRNTYKVQYYQNQISMESNPNKSYYTLSFCYDFKFEVEQVQFCHFYPYGFEDLQMFLKKVSNSPKIKIKTLGFSALKKPLYIIQISDGSKSTDTPVKQKQALIFFARQHSGQIQSSFLIQQLVQDLLKPSSLFSKQIQFLLQRFDVYIFPMINVDGVVLGNYRTNAYGYDLNRYWDSENSFKLPEIYHIKNHIKKIAKKQKISMILDFHGHSRKMASFFFGNNYGKNNMLFPYIASTMSEMIDFKSCTFTRQKSQSSKCRTARAVLGNILKQTTNFYTFQMSFFGYRKGTKKIAFTLQDFKKISRSLLSSIYKIQIEKFKQEKTQKQSIYLKQIQKQIGKQLANFLQEQESGSDSEAETITMKQDQIKIEIEQKDLNNRQKNQNNMTFKSEPVLIQTTSIGVQTNIQLTKLDKVLIKAMKSSYMNKSHLISQQSFEENVFDLKASLQKNLNQKQNYQDSLQIFNNNIIPKLKYLKDRERQTSANFYSLKQSRIQSKKNSIQQFGRKQFLLQKLRIFGQNITEDNQEIFMQKNNNNKCKNPCKQTQTQTFEKNPNQNSFNFQIMNKEMKNNDKEMKNKDKQKFQFKKDLRSKRKNFSLVLKGDRNIKNTQQDMLNTLKLKSTKLRSKKNLSPSPKQYPSHFEAKRNRDKNSISLGVILSSQKIQGLKYNNRGLPQFT